MQGKSTFLSQAAFSKIHTPFENWGMGWELANGPDAGPISSHAGSIGTHFAYTVIAPNANRAVMVACNCMDQFSSTAVQLFADRVARARN